MSCRARSSSWLPEAWRPAVVDELRSSRNPPLASRSACHPTRGRPRHLPVQVDPCAFPVPARVIHRKPGGSKETRAEFFVRVANGTKALDAVERERTS